MASLIAMRRVYASADQTMFYIISCRERHICVGAVMWIDIDCKVKLLALCGSDQIGNDLIVVGAIAVLCADRDLVFCAGEPTADTAHIDGKYFCDI